MTEPRAIWRCPNWCVFYTSSYPQGNRVRCGGWEVPFDENDLIYLAHQAEIRKRHARYINWLDQALAQGDFSLDEAITELFAAHRCDITLEGVIE